MAGTTNVDVLARVALHNLAARVNALSAQGVAPVKDSALEMGMASLAVVSGSVAVSETGRVPKGMWAEGVVGLLRVAVAEGWDLSELGELITKEIEHGRN